MDPKEKRVDPDSDSSEALADALEPDEITEEAHPEEALLQEALPEDDDTEEVTAPPVLPRETAGVANPQRSRPGLEHAFVESRAQPLMHWVVGGIALVLTLSVIAAMLAA